MNQMLTSGMALVLTAATATANVDDYGSELGTVRFPVSCDEAAAAHAERGLALLHHMTYEAARGAFDAAIESDADCVMGYWGQAMTYIHPLWSDPPSEEEFEQGQALVEKAQSRGDKSEWEQAYIEAVEAYYAPGRNRDEQVNLSNMAEAWQQVHEQFPEDPEAAAFHALSHMATADPEDKSYAKQKQAAEIAKTVLEQNSDHPGAHHYIIHAYDYPPLAERALDVARSYGEMAPAVPHALHMPGHIFTRLGLWEESIDMNRRSAAAALEHPEGDTISMHYLHALDYLAYAHLQRGEDEKAREVLNTLQSLEQPVQPHVASAYTFAAVPARFALERHDWERAASLEAKQPRDFPWDEFPAMEAISHFAQALGSARSGDEQAARQAIQVLSKLHDKATDASAYWAKQVEIQRLAATGWLAWAEGNQQEAVRTMAQAAQLEGETEKHPVTPGEVLPARELYADMLLELDRHEEALSEYQAALERSPRRFNSLYGAGRAAEMAGDSEEAAEYYEQLVELAAADAERDRLNEAKRFLEQSAAL